MWLVGWLVDFPTVGRIQPTTGLTDHRSLTPHVYRHGTVDCQWNRKVCGVMGMLSAHRECAAQSPESREVGSSATVWTDLQHGSEAL